ncbi:ABC transporter permease [Ilumatobacter sp.]|uniref:ABC transporter permease n=1 Tax=Ilumatobacter sp. TaxID=1967498 RepID=UPI003752138A
MIETTTTPAAPALPTRNAPVTTNSPRSRIFALAHHEYRAAVRSRILLALLGIIVTVTAVSVYIASVDYRSKLADYEMYKAAAEAGGVARIAPSLLAPLSLLRGSLEYLEIIGAVIAIALGYLTVSRERSNRTLAMIRSRPVSSGEQMAGSLLGALAVIGTLVAVTAMVGIVCVGSIGNDWINAAQGFKLLLAYLGAVVYMGVFYGVGVIATAHTKVTANGLMIALGVWLLIVLILPQLGDTLDADNQIPGGLFSALGLDRAGETKILEHFTLYEKTRIGIEELSFAKHFERFSFAMTDVQDKYRGFSLGQLLAEKRNDIGWLIAYPIALMWGLRRSFRNQPTLPPTS